MKCPACSHTLSPRTLGKITFDVCENGCGGIWFDWLELQKVDEQHEKLGEPLMDIQPDPTVRVDPAKRRSCPKCKKVVMMRHFASVKHEIELDECPRCGGFWLDAGELRQMREQYKTDAERSAAAKELFRDITAQAFAEMHAESRENRNRKMDIARMFRFVCPSHYIPGDQDWGAF